MLKPLIRVITTKYSEHEPSRHEGNHTLFPPLDFPWLVSQAGPTQFATTFELSDEATPSRTGRHYPGRTSKWQGPFHSFHLPGQLSDPPVPLSKVLSPPPGLSHGQSPRLEGASVFSLVMRGPLA